MNDADLILVGAGLANGLIAWRLKSLRPSLRVLLLDSATHLGGRHTWSFHDKDLTPAQHAWLTPLIVHHWQGYDVIFPGRERQLPGGYASLTSERFAQVLEPALADSLRLGCPVSEVQPTRVILASGTTLNANAVIDGRGLPTEPDLVLGCQQFLGQTLQLAAPHGLERPILMDAVVPQGDGYRFVYILPLSPDTLLIEDTHYVDQQRLSPQTLRQHIADYADARGWRIVQVLGEEVGALPITLAGDFDAFWARQPGQPRAGLRAGLFHCTTGYSLPEAVRLADLIARRADLSAAGLYRAIRSHAYQHWRSQGFYRLLNRMLFLAGKPHERWRILERFYGLPTPLIERFYAGSSSLTDCLRIVSGKPPVPLLPALRAALQVSPQQHEQRFP